MVLMVASILITKEPPLKATLDIDGAIYSSMRRSARFDSAKR